jgi:hypothetical protein
VTLREQITADVSSVFLNDEDFAETLIYKPACGGSRTITGVVDEDGTYPELANEKDSIEFLSVFVSRDATNGIDNPQLGDRISRVIDGEGNEAKAYTYLGEKAEVDENAWTLKFTRQYTVLKGGNRRQ